MKAPVCRICSFEGFGHTCMGLVHERPTREKKQQALSRAVARVAEVLARPEPKPIKRRGKRGTFDRNAYQKELMRRRRAAEKDQPGEPSDA